MEHKKMKTNYNLIIIELLIYELLRGVYVNLIGSISLGDIMAIIMLPFVFRDIPFNNYPVLKKVTWLYLIYLGTQILSEIVIQNDLTNAIKGFAVTILSYISVMYLFARLKDRLILIPYMLFLEALNALIFMQSADIASSGMEFDMTSVAFFKFKIVPIISNIVMVICYILLKRGYKKATILLLFSVVIFYIFKGSRSASLVLFLSASILLFSKYLILYKKSMPFLLCFFTIFIYMGYLLWITNISSINSNSSEQVQRMSNIYNPFELLEQGRTDVIVGMNAFTDKLMWGHGSWAMDKDMKYTYQMVKLTKGYVPQGYGRNSRTMPVPSHSVLIGAGVANGIFAFIAMSTLFLFFIKLGYRLIKGYLLTPFIAIVFYLIFQLIWIFLFSPTSHLRQSLPFIFALMLVFSYQVYRFKIRSIFYSLKI